MLLNLLVQNKYNQEQDLSAHKNVLHIILPIHKVHDVMKRNSAVPTKKIRDFTKWKQTVPSSEVRMLFYRIREVYATFINNGTNLYETAIALSTTDVDQNTCGYESCKIL